MNQALAVYGPQQRQQQQQQQQNRRVVFFPERFESIPRNLFRQQYNIPNLPLIPQFAGQNFRVPLIQQQQRPPLLAIGEEQKQQNPNAPQQNLGGQVQQPVQQQTFRERMYQALNQIAQDNDGAVINVPAAKNAITKPPTELQEKLRTAQTTVNQYFADENNQEVYKNALYGMYSNLGFDVSNRKIQAKINDEVARTTNNAISKLRPGPSDKYRIDAANMSNILMKGPRIGSILDFVSSGVQLLDTIRRMTGVSSVGLMPNGSASFQYVRGGRNFPITRLKKDCMRIRALMAKAIKSNGGDVRKHLGYQKLSQIVIPILKAFACYNEIGTALSRFANGGKKFGSAEAFQETLERGIRARAKGLPKRLIRTILMQRVAIGEIPPDTADQAITELTDGFHLRTYLGAANDFKRAAIPGKIAKIVQKRNERVQKAPQTEQQMAVNMANQIIQSFNADNEAINKYLTQDTRGMTLFPKRKYNQAEAEERNNLRYDKLIQGQQILKSLKKKYDSGRRRAFNRNFRPQEEADLSYAIYADRMKRFVGQSNESHNNANRRRDNLGGNILNDSILGNNNNQRQQQFMQESLDLSNIAEQPVGNMDMEDSNFFA